MNEGKSEEAITEEELRIASYFKLPEYKSVLLIHNSSFRIQFLRKKPVPLVALLVLDTAWLAMA